MKVNLGPTVAYASQAICLAIYFIAIRSLLPQKSWLKVHISAVQVTCASRGSTGCQRAARRLMRAPNCCLYPS